MFEDLNEELELLGFADYQLRLCDCLEFKRNRKSLRAWEVKNVWETDARKCEYCPSFLTPVQKCHCGSAKCKRSYDAERQRERRKAQLVNREEMHHVVCVVCQKEFKRKTLAGKKPTVCSNECLRKKLDAKKAGAQCAE